jgi:hypothetical protein
MKVRICVRLEPCASSVPQRCGSVLVALLTAFVVAVTATPLEGQAGGGAQVEVRAQTSIGADTLRTRADSLRAQVLERVRILSEPPVLDTVQSDSASREAVGPDGGFGFPAMAAGGSRGDTRPSAIYLPPGADSVLLALSQLPGFTIATYEAHRIEFDAGTQRLRLLAGDSVPARFAGQGVRVEADSAITYDDLAGRVRTSGSTLLTPDRGEPVRSQALIYDVALARGTALGAETTYAEAGGEWIVRGNLDSVEQGRIYGSRTRFTSDDRPEPNSHFEAAELLVLADQILVARSVSLHFSEVPVLWLPFIAQPLQSGRSSGLLTPTFSVNDIVRTSGGYERRISNIGAYWAISDYADARLAMEWWSGRYTALTTSLQYGVARRFVTGELSSRRFWREDGRQDLALSTRNAWEPTERTRVNVAGNYVSNTGLIRQNSFDPVEQTSSIDSQAGLQHRFGWGNASVEARRQQFLSDDRLEMTLPSGTLSLSTLTLFRAAPSQASWYNNMTLNASSSFNRSIREFPAQADTTRFQFARANQGRTQGRGRASLSLGNLSLSGEVGYQESLFRDIPIQIARPDLMAGDWIGEVSLPGGLDDRVDFSTANVTWNTSISFQQRLIGSTSITPSLTLGSQMVRVDSIPEARDFVHAPVRLSFGVGTQAELFAFFPGFAGFEAIRHKITPGVSYSYAPAVAPTPLQERVFGARELRVQNALNFTFNQTFEAKARTPSGAASTTPSPAGEARAGIGAEEGSGAGEGVAEADAADQRGSPWVSSTDLGAGGRASGLQDAGLQRLPPSRVVTLLGLSTSAVSYDLVQADSTGRWVDGFTTTQLRNTVRSDYLRGLDLSFSHDLFDERRDTDLGRAFSPHLEQVSLGFSLDGSSALTGALARLLGVSQGGTPRVGSEVGASVGGGDITDPFGPTSGGFDADRIIPGSGRGSRAGFTRREGWNARLDYSLRRPRPGAFGGRSEALNALLSFQPTPLLAVSWRTSYDLEQARFSDHTIQVMRDMYDWEASFGFRQGINGNWTFQFEVSLKANRDLRFDYEQRNLSAADPFGF